jgi:uncharacterized protein (TIGR04168 family)
MGAFQDSNPIGQPIRIAIVGDVHEQWSAADSDALQALNLDLVLFVGDFGNESVDVVRQIAALPLPKAVILGNHDAWYSASPWGRAKCPYDRATTDRLQEQLDLLGPTHVGFSHLDFPDLNLSIVGSRPFSWGGPDWKNKSFYQERYGVSSFEDSAQRIAQTAQAAQFDRLILLGHNGPHGLGAEPEDPCGKDWMPIGGDHGDPDLTDAIHLIKTQGKQIPLVTFGHMHHNLRNRNDRLRTSAILKQDTLYLNAARCPRVIETDRGLLRNFTIVTFVDTELRSAELVWVDQTAQIASRESLWLAGEGNRGIRVGA